MINWMRLGAPTSTSIEPANSDREAKNHGTRTSPFMYPTA